MSRIGRMPITVPAGVEVSIAAGNVVTVKGPKGTLVQTLHPEMILEQEGNIIHVKRPTDDKAHCALHGMTRALLHNILPACGRPGQLRLRGRRPPGCLPLHRGSHVQDGLRDADRH